MLFVLIVKSYLVLRKSLNIVPYNWGTLLINKFSKEPLESIKLSVQDIFPLLRLNSFDKFVKLQAEAALGVSPCHLLEVSAWSSLMSSSSFCHLDIEQYFHLSVMILLILNQSSKIMNMKHL